MAIKEQFCLPIDPPLPPAIDEWDSYMRQRLFNEAKASSKGAEGLKDPPPVPRDCPRVELVDLRLRVLRGDYDDDVGVSSDLRWWAGRRDGMGEEQDSKDGVDLETVDVSESDWVEDIDPSDDPGWSE
jgi:hypothetical protein